MAANQQDWVDHLELAEFCYNNLEHSAMGVTPFQMVTGKSPIVPTTWVGQPPSDASEEVPMVTQLVATLALGSRPRLRGLQGCKPRGRKPGSQGKSIARVRAKRKPGS